VRAVPDVEVTGIMDEANVDALEGARETASGDSILVTAEAVRGIATGSTVIALCDACGCCMACEEDSADVRGEGKGATGAEFCAADWVGA
jgi:hypothetical protein